MTHDALAAGELIEQLRESARQHSAAHKMLADAKSDRQTDRDDYPELGTRGYDWIKPEQTTEWQAADLLESVLADLTAANARVEEAEGAIRPFAKMGKLLDGPFGPALFKDEDTIGVGGAWSENGKPRSITFGDLRKAAQWLADREGRS